MCEDLLGAPALSPRDRSIVLEHMARIADGFARSGRHAEVACTHAIVLETGGARVPDRARIVAAVRDETEAGARANDEARGELGIAVEILAF